MVVKCENVRISWNVTDFGSITNDEIKIHVINAHVRKVLEVARSRIERLRLQRVRQRQRVTSSFARGESHLAVVNV